MNKISVILLVYDRTKYQEVLAETIKPTDTVIEIGPHVGGSTGVIAARAKKVIAVDKSEQAAAVFKDKPYKNVTFIKGDVRFFETIDKVSAVLKTDDRGLKTADRCDVLAVDMGGGRFPDTLFKVWCVWSGVLKPRDSIIRNNGLAEFIQRTRIEDPGLKTGYPDAGWLSNTGRKTPKQAKEGLEELKNWIVTDK